MQAYRKTAHPVSRGGYQGWEKTEVADTLNEYDISEARVPVIVVRGGRVYDARGNGDGQISPTITGDHQNRVTDYTAIVVQSNDEDIHGSTVLQVEEG